MTGQPYDRVTISPNGFGQTLAQAGILIEVYCRDNAGQPVAGLPAPDIRLANSNLVICLGGTDSDAGTEAQGVARFTGTLRAGGCVEFLDVIAQDVPINRRVGSMVTVKTNSYDGGLLTTPGGVDSSDLALFASRLGFTAPCADPVSSVNCYTICMDWNESGPPTIDSSDIAAFAQQLGARCQ